MNLVEASLEGDEVVFGGFRLRLDPSRRPRGAPAKVVLGIRPEAFEHVSRPSGNSTLPVVPAVVEELGPEAHVFFHVEAPPVTAEILAKGDEGTLLPESRSLFAARLDPATPARVGLPLELAVNAARLHFFDARTGSSLLSKSQAAAHEQLAPAAT
jgi:ABC-type sugar transport system ATPase subunit